MRRVVHGDFLSRFRKAWLLLKLLLNMILSLLVIKLLLKVHCSCSGSSARSAHPSFEISFKAYFKGSLLVFCELRSLRSLRPFFFYSFF